MHAKEDFNFSCDTIQTLFCPERRKTSRELEVSYISKEVDSVIQCVSLCQPFLNMSSV